MVLKAGSLLLAHQNMACLADYGMEVRDGCRIQLYLVFTNGALYIIGATKSEELSEDVIESEYIDPSHLAGQAIQAEQ